MLQRFLAADLDVASRSATLPSDETHHLTHVLRLGSGAEIAVFDGKGREFRARVERVARGRAGLRLLDEIEPAPEPRVALTLAQAVLKGQKMDDVVRDATMMGVRAVTPVISEHTAVRQNALADGRAAERWRRVAVASAKQCRRAVLPDIGSGVTFDAVVAQAADAARVLLVEPSAGVAPQPASALQGRTPASATVLVGPEGGWSPGEIALAVNAGWTPVTLGRRTLRADAVPIVAIGILQFLWGDL